VLLAASACTGPNTDDWVQVKYRKTGKVPVCDTGTFEMVWTNIDGCPKVRGKRYQMSNAWYDKGEEYMVVRLGWGGSASYYHYCGVEKITWNQFKRTATPGVEYNGERPYPFYERVIKGNFDCRRSDAIVPDYGDSTDFP
jgi:hypothetical protein